MSNSGANNLCSATMGAGMKHALEKDLHAFSLRLGVCLFSFHPGGLLEVCLYVFEVLGCVFFLLFFSPCLWLLLSKQSCAGIELVAHSFSRCLGCGLISMLTLPVIKTILPLSLSVFTSLQKMIIIGVLCAVVVLIILIIILTQTL